MSGTLTVALVTPSQKVAQATADMVVAPSVVGQLGILPLHAPLVAELGLGVVELRAGPRADAYFITGGFLEVASDQVVVLAETAEPVEAIDVGRARADLAAAEGALQKMTAGDPTYADEVARAERARLRIQVARPPRSGNTP